MSIAKLKILNNLRQSIPGIECIPGCSQCCGHVPWSFFELSHLSREERQRLNHFSLKCSFFTDHGCSVYENRPISCRVFGVCEGMNCPRGVPVPEMLDRATVEFIIGTYNKVFFQGESL